MAIDWDALHAGLWQAVVAQTEVLAQSTAGYTAAIIESLRASGWELDAESEQRVTDLLAATDEILREGIERAVAPIVAAVHPGARAAQMRSEWMARQVAEAYDRRWPDGLDLSQRVWRWQDETRRGVSEVLAAGVRTGAATGRVQMDIQRAIEAQAGERFAITTAQTRDWASDLYDAARASIRSPGGVDYWDKTVKRAISHIEGLKDGGTRRQAQHALAQMRKAVAAGRMDLLEKQMHWWIYDRQQYAIRRVVRTEMATASHRAVIGSTIEDDLIVGYLWRLSGSHPVADICDVYAGVDFGLGKGVFPKDRVPAGKAHPHCMCSLTPTTRRQRRDGAEGKYSEQDLIEQAKGGYRVWGEPTAGNGAEGL